MVIRFGFRPPPPPQLTRTTGTGDNTFPGFQDCFAILSLFEIPSGFMIFFLFAESSLFTIPHCPFILEE
jgi:hypothetical protein